MGGGSQNTQQSQTQAPNPIAMAGYQNVMSGAQNIAQKNQIWNPATGVNVAGQDPMQMQGYQGIQGQLGEYSGQINQAMGMAQNAGQGVTGSDIQNFQNPYTQQVINSTMANAQQQQGAQLQNVVGSQIAQNAQGGDRAQLQKALTEGQFAMANNATTAGLEQGGYNSALAAAQAQKGQELQASYGLANQAAGAQNYNLQGLGAMIGAGGAQQGQQQNVLNAATQNANSQQMWPMQMQQWLAGQVGGMGSLMGGTTTGDSKTSQSPGFFNYLGAGLGGLSAMSDERTKENKRVVGELYDGQKVYAYNYKGHPVTQLGLLAQEVEKHHPESVGETGGIKSVQYDMATHDAARRGHFANGGAPGMAAGGDPWNTSNSPWGSLLQAGPQQARANFGQLPNAPALNLDQGNKDQGKQAKDSVKNVKDMWNKFNQPGQGQNTGAPGEANPAGGTTTPGETNPAGASPTPGNTNPAGGNASLGGTNPVAAGGNNAGGWGTEVVPSTTVSGSGETGAWTGGGGAGGASGGETLSLGGGNTLSVGAGNTATAAGGGDLLGMGGESAFAGAAPAFGATTGAGAAGASLAEGSAAAGSAAAGAGAAAAGEGAAAAGAGASEGIGGGLMALLALLADGGEASNEKIAGLGEMQDHATRMMKRAGGGEVDDLFSDSGPDTSGMEISPHEKRTHFDPYGGLAASGNVENMESGKNREASAAIHAAKTFAKKNAAEQESADEPSVSPGSFMSPDYASDQGLRARIAGKADQPQGDAPYRYLAPDAEGRGSRAHELAFRREQPYEDPKVRDALDIATSRYTQPKEPLSSGRGAESPLPREGAPATHELPGDARVPGPFSSISNAPLPPAPGRPLGVSPLPLSEAFSGDLKRHEDTTTTPAIKDALSRAARAVTVNSAPAPDVADVGRRAVEPYTQPLEQGARDVGGAFGEAGRNILDARAANAARGAANPDVGDVGRAAVAPLAHEALSRAARAVTVDGPSAPDVGDVGRGVVDRALTPESGPLSAQDVADARGRYAAEQEGTWDDFKAWAKSQVPGHATDQNLETIRQDYADKQAHTKESVRDYLNGLIPEFTTPEEAAASRAERASESGGLRAPGRGDVAELIQSIRGAGQMARDQFAPSLTPEEAAASRAERASESGGLRAPGRGDVAELIQSIRGAGQMARDQFAPSLTPEEAAASRAERLNGQTVPPVGGEGPTPPIPERSGMKRQSEVDPWTTIRANPPGGYDEPQTNVDRFTDALKKVGYNLTHVEGRPVLWDEEPKYSPRGDEPALPPVDQQASKTVPTEQAPAPAKTFKINPQTGERMTPSEEQAATEKELAHKVEPYSGGVGAPKAGNPGEDIPNRYGQGAPTPITKSMGFENDLGGVTRDTGGNPSMGHYGIMATPGGGSASEFFHDHGAELGFTHNPRQDPWGFAADWKRVAKENPQGLEAAEDNWHDKYIKGSVRAHILNAGLPGSVSEDPRVQQYFQDRYVQHGTGISKNSDGRNGAGRINQAWSGAEGDIPTFLKNMSAIDKSHVRQDFDTYLSEHPDHQPGLEKRISNRLAGALGETVQPGGKSEQVAEAGKTKGEAEAAQPKTTAELPDHQQKQVEFVQKIMGGWNPLEGITGPGKEGKDSWNPLGMTSDQRRNLMVTGLSMMGGSPLGWQAAGAGAQGMQQGQQMQMNEQSMGVQRAKLALEAMNQPKFQPAHWTDLMGVQHAGSMDVHSGAITEAGQTAPVSGASAPAPGSVQVGAPSASGAAGAAGAPQPTGEPRVDQMFQQYPGTRDEAEGVLDGSKKLSDFPAARRMGMEEAVRAVAKQRGEKYDPETLAIKNKFRKDYNSGENKEGMIKQALETGTTHLGDLTELNKVLPDHNRFMAANFYGPKEEAFGHDKNRNAWITMTHGLAGELAKLEGGGQGTAEDRKKWENDLSPDQPREKRASSLAAAVRLMHGNLQGLEQKWDTTIGKTWKKPDILSEGSRATIEKANQTFWGNIAEKGGAEPRKPVTVERDDAVESIMKAKQTGRTDLIPLIIERARQRGVQGLEVLQ